jgi:hypothetical protein
MIYRVSNCLTIALLVRSRGVHSLYSLTRDALPIYMERSSQLGHTTQGLHYDSPVYLERVGTARQL